MVTAKAQSTEKKKTKSTGKRSATLGDQVAFESTERSALELRLKAVEKRLQAIEVSRAHPDVLAGRAESGAGSVGAPDAVPHYWALQQLQQLAPKGGAVLYTGTVDLPSGGQYIWQKTVDANRLMKLNWVDLVDTLSALGHPVRLAVLKACIGQGRTTQELLGLPDMGTTGQLFHHIKALQQSGWLRVLQRGVYEVPGERVVPLMAILAAALG